jgi:acetyl-CoA C-acetyltransferase
VIRALLQRTRVGPEAIDDVVLGQGYPKARPPRSGGSPRSTPAYRSDVPGVQLDRRCGSGLQANCDAAMRVQTGVADVVLV